MMVALDKINQRHYDCEVEMSKGKQRKEAWQDNFIKHWCCSSHNHPEGWAWWKRYNRKQFRRMMRDRTRKETGEGIADE